MDAKDRLIKELKQKLLLRETQLQRKSAQFEQSQSRLADVAAKLEQTNSQHSATAEQFTQTLAQKERELAALKHQVKLLLQRIRGSRQERINPDQLLLFSVEELQQLAKELEEQPEPQDRQAAEDDSSASGNGKPTVKKKGHGRQPLPKNLPCEVVRHELTEQERRCPCCGEARVEICVQSSQQLEFIPAC